MDSGRVLAAEQEPIAIVGVGCRFPGGVDDLASYWRLLRDGVDAVTEIPEDRWSIQTFYDPTPGTPGKSYSKWGGFVDGISAFEPERFGISPREATFMDPQQRLLLEVSWEAIEDAGWAPDQLAGTDTGVFVGVSISDYNTLQGVFGYETETDPHMATGAALSVTSNRISYCLNLIGPSISVDTACSSSLVAVDLACRRIWRGDCRVALAGGVNLMLTPAPFLAFSAATMLAADGRCKTFDSRADGFVRGEGAGIVMLKRLSDAQADRDPIHALITGTGVNQDGRTSGIAMPSESSQAMLIREVCDLAGIAPSAVDYVEAHGTGTAVGDPIEAKALGTVLGAGRETSDSCYLGSVKTNIGHLESAAGIAGLLKALLVLKHREVPKHLNFEKPNPALALDDWKLKVPMAVESLPSRDRPALAAVNSFGFGGTNAHAILQEYLEEPEPRPERSAVRPHLLALSARTAEALEDLASAYVRELSGPAAGEGARLTDLCYTAATGRVAMAQRAAVVGKDAAAMREQLSAYLGGDKRAVSALGESPAGSSPKVAFVFSGQGPQWWGMGQQLLASEPVFRETIETCDALIRAEADWSLLDELSKEEADSNINLTRYAQPSLFALQVGLARLLGSWGVEPMAVVGHSIGEVAAAHASGALSIADATRVALHRGRTMDRASSKGRMLAVGLPADEATRLIASDKEEVSLAAINGPASVTLSGEPQVLQRIADRMTDQDVFNSFLEVDYAFHSPQMDPVEDALIEALTGLACQETQRPMISSVTGAKIDGKELHSGYWWRNVRQTVRFVEAFQALLDQGCNTFLELSPHPVLSGAMGEALLEQGVKGRAIPTLRRKEDEQVAMLTALGSLFTVGQPIDWDKLWPGEPRRTRAPKTPWRRESYWHEAAEIKKLRIGTSFHPLLGHRQPTADPTWRGNLDLRVLRYLEDHRLRDVAIFPAAGFIEMALAMAREVSDPGPIRLEDVRFRKVLHLPSGKAGPKSSVTLRTEDGSYSVSSGTGSTVEWMVHSTGYLGEDEPEGPQERVNLEQLEAGLPHHALAEEGYRIFADAGLTYGPAFQGVHSLSFSETEGLAEVRLPESLVQGARAYVFHPVLLDSCFQVSAALQTELSTAVYLPVQIACVKLYRSPGTVIRPHVILRSLTPALKIIDIRIYDPDGYLLMTFDTFVLQATLRDRTNDVEKLLYRVKWYDQPLLVRCDSEPPPRVPTHSEVGERVLKESGIEPSEEALSSQLTAWMEMNSAASHQANELGVAYIFVALDQLGLSLCQDREVAASEFDELPIHEDYRKLLLRFRTILASSGYLVQGADADSWPVAKVPPESDLRAQWRSLLFQHPACLAELNLLGRFGSRLAQVLRGDLDPLELLFPDGSMDLAEFMYRDSPSCYKFNRAIRHAVDLQIGKMARGRPLRIIEIGGGTGGLTSHILPILPAHRTRYVFTDISPIFFPNVQGKLRGYDFVELQTLDIEKDPQEQDFEPGSFDIVVASNVFHATRCLRTTLANVKKLLSGEGLLVFLDLANAAPWFDVVFGLMKGWWRFSDHELRPTHPLLRRPQWHALLEESGFTSVQSVPASDETGQVVVWGQGPAKEEGSIEQQTESAEPADPHSNESDAAVWVILADRSGLGEGIAAALRERGSGVVLVSAGGSFQQLGDETFQVSPGSHDDFSALLSAATEGGGHLRGVIHLWGLDAASLGAVELDRLQAAETLTCHSLMHLVQAADAHPKRPSEYRVMLVTRGAQPVDGEIGETALLQSHLLGMGKVLVNEHADIDCRMLDLSPAPLENEAEIVLAELFAVDNEDEVAIRGQVRLVPRVEHEELERIEALDLDKGRRFVMENQQPGVLDRITLVEAERQAPGPGQVEIEVAATGLNFRDVLKAMDLYPKDSPDSLTFGDECAGTVTKVGEGVEGVAVGDEVIAFATGSLASHVTTHAAGVIKKPPHLSFEDAVTMPVPFLTALYALHSVGRIQPGESLLVQAATGGVGLAALQVGERAGASLYATAGNPQKREFLSLFGLDHIMNSRTLAFADDIARFTDGRGVDLVLNSLAGKAIAKGLSCLAPYGRFLEIGKRDIYEDSHIGLWPFHKGLSFLAIDLSRVLGDRSQASNEILQEFSRMIGEREIHPLPYRTFRISQMSEAMRYMAQAKHIGKIVIAMKDREAEAYRPFDASVSFRADATYVVTGGFGGLGLEVARWIVENGGRNLVLIGRSGATSEEARDKIEELTARGVTVFEALVDIRDTSAVSDMLQDVRQSMPPLKGIIHGAMVIEDGAIVQLDSERFRRTTGPKVDGAWNLHALTGEDALDFFVMFSSMSSVAGQQGQANYAAANSFLDTLAHYRRARGLPAATINWGAITDVGFVARSDKYSSLVEISGIKGQEFLQALGYLIKRNSIQTGVLRADWRAFAASLSGRRLLTRFSTLIDEAPDQASEEGAGEVRKTILAAPSEERLGLIRQYLRDQVGQVVGMGSGKLTDSQPLAEVGLDSLMALELRVQLEKDLLVSLPVTTLMQGPVTVESLAEAVEGLVMGETAAPKKPRESGGVTAQEETPVASLVPLQSAGSAPPLFCLHPAGGRLKAFEALCSRLAPVRPVFGVEMLASGGKEFQSIEEMAASYKALIRDHQPHGPYSLAGFSFGGLVALSIAAQLEAEGQEVEFLAMMDPQIIPDAESSDKAAFLTNIINETSAEVRRQLGLAAPDSDDRLRAEAAAVASRVHALNDQDASDAVVDWLAGIEGLKGDPQIADVRALVDAVGHHVRIASRFQPPVVDASLDIWLAGRSTFGDRSTDWSLSTRGACRQVTLDVSHYDLMRAPAIDGIAERCRGALSS